VFIKKVKNYDTEKKKTDEIFNNKERSFTMVRKKKKKKTVVKKKSTRAAAIEKEYTKAEKGGRFRNRAWYIDRDALKKAGIMQEYKSPEGDNFIAIIPPKRTDIYFGESIYVHYDINSNKDAALCPLLMSIEKGVKRERCPICEKRDKLKEAGVDYDTIKHLRPTLRFLFFIVDTKDSETVKKGLQIYDAPSTINDEIMKLSKDRRTKETIDISDPDEKKEISFERIGTVQNNTRYKGVKIQDRTLEIKNSVYDNEKILKVCL